MTVRTTLILMAVETGHTSGGQAKAEHYQTGQGNM